MVRMSYCVTKCVLSCVCLLLAFLPALAQEDAAPTTDENPPSAQTQDGSPGSTTASDAKSEEDKAADAKSEERNIRFQFEAVPYREVLQRFAQMTNKPILGDLALDGTVTFNDPRPYTYREALDTLNVILGLKGFVLVETDRYLRLAPKSELPQLPLKIFRGLESKEGARPGEMVTVVLPLQHLDATEAAAAATKLLSGTGTISPVQSGRGLVVTDRMESVRRIQELVVQLDVETQRVRGMKTFQVTHSSGTVLAEMLRRTFGPDTAPRESRFVNGQWIVAPVDPSQFLRVSFDQATRMLALFGPTSQLEAATELVERFEADSTSAAQMRLYHPQLTSADELARLIREAISGIAPAGQAPDGISNNVRVIADNARNRLIVLAPTEAQLGAVDQFIRGVDGEATENGGGGYRSVEVTRVLRCKNANPNELVRVIERATGSMDVLGRFQSRLRTSVEGASSSVIVTGGPGDVQTAERLHSQLDADLPSPGRETHLVELDDVEDVEHLSTLLQALYREGLRDDTSQGAPDAQFFADTVGRRLIITARKPQFALIDSLVEQLKGTTTAASPRTFRILSLKFTPADRLVSTLEELLRQRSPRRRGDTQPYIVADTARSRLLVTATEEDLTTIEELLPQLDVAPDAPQREMRTLTPQQKTPSEYARLLGPLLAQDGRQGVNVPAPQLIPDDAGGRLLVLAAPEDHERIDEYMRQLDDTATERNLLRSTRLIPVYGVRVDSLLSLVKRLYDEGLHGRRMLAGARATILSDPTHERLLVSGSEAEIELVEKIVRQLNPETDNGSARTETRVFRLEATQANRLVGLLRGTLNPDPQRERLRILLDEPSNSIIVSGLPADLDAASKLIRELDVRQSRGPQEIRVVELRVGRAEALAPLVTQIFSERIRSEQGAGYQPEGKVVADSGTNRLIVTAPPGEMELISSIVDDLNQPQVREDDSRVFQLQHADAEALVETLTAATLKRDPRGREISRLRFSADVATNSLIVSGSTEDLNVVAPLVEQLDVERSSVPVSVRVIPISSGNGGQVANIAREIWAAKTIDRHQARDVTIAAAPDNRGILIVGPQALLREVEEVVATADGGGLLVSRSLDVIELKGRDAEEMARMVNQALRATPPSRAGQPTITADSRGERLLVMATEEEAASIRDIVAKLDGDGPPGQELVAIPFPNVSRLKRLMPLIERLYGEQAGSSLPPSRRAVMVVDEVGQRLLITGPPVEVARVVSTVQELEGGVTTETDERQTRRLDIGPRDAAELQTLVRSLYDAQVIGGSAEEETPPTIVADGTTPGQKARHLLVTGTLAQIERVQNIIAELGDVAAAARTSETVPLYNYRAQGLLPLLNQLYDAQQRGAPPLIGGPATVVADVRGRGLIVTGTAEEIERVKQIVRQLDPEESAGGPEETRVFRLRVARAGELKGLVERVVATGPGRSLVQVDADTPTNSLVVTGPRSSVEAAASIVRELDNEVESQARELRVIELQAGSASAIAPVARQLLVDSMQSIRGIGYRVRASIVPEDTTNRLLVTAPPSEMAVLGPILDELNTVRLKQDDTHFVELRSANAEDIARLLSEVMTQRDSRGRVMPLVRVAADKVTNSLVISGATTDIETARKFIEQFDSGEAITDPTVRVVELSERTAEELAPLVERLWQEENKGRTSRGRVSVSSDPTGRRVAIVAPETSIEDVVALVRQVDGQENSQRELRLLELKTRTAQELAPLVRRAHESQYPQLKASVTITADERANRLLVLAPPAAYEAIQKIVAALDTAPDRAPRQISMITVAHKKASDLLPLVKQLYREQRPDETTTPPRITADSAANRLVVVSNTEQLEVIRGLIESLDGAVEEPARETRFFEMTPRDNVTRLVPLLNQLYREAFPAEVRSGRADARFTADARTHRLMVSARAEQLEKIGELITNLRTPMESEPRQTRVYDLKSALAEDLAKTVSELYRDRSKDRLTARPDDALVLADATTNRLIVTAPASELAVLEEIIGQIDELSPYAASTRIFKLSVASAVEVANILSTALTRRERNRVVPLVSAGADAKSNTVVVSGEPRDVQSAVQLIEQLDAGGQTGPRSLRMFEVVGADAKEVAGSVRQLYENHVRGNPELGLADAFILGEPATSRLIVTASDPHLTVIEEIVEKVGLEGGVSSLETKVLPLERGSGTAIAAILSELYRREIETDENSERVSVSSSPDGQLLAVSAPRGVLVKIESLVAEMQKQQDVAVFEVRTYRLDQSEVLGLAANLQHLFSGDEGDGESGSAGFRPRFTADPSTGHLIVAATAELLPQIDETIKNLQSAAETASQTRTFRLNYGEAREVAELLTTMLSEETSRDRRGPAPLSPQARVVAAPALNAVVVRGGVAAVAVAAQIIESLDAPPASRQGTIRVVKLNKASAAAVARTIRDAMRASGPEPETREVRVTADPNSNTVLIQGPTQAVDDVLKIIDQLDDESEPGGIDLRIYKLENGRVQEVSTMLRSLLNSLLSTQQALRPGIQRPPVTIAVDRRSNSILVSTAESVYPLVEKLLTQLDTVPESADRSVQFIELSNLNAGQVVERLRPLFADRAVADAPLLEALPETNSISVIALESDVKIILDLVGQLEDAAPGNEVEARVIALSQIPAEKMVELIQGVYSQIGNSELQVTDRLPRRVHRAATIRSSIQSSRSNPSEPDARSDGQGGEQQEGRRPLRKARTLRRLRAGADESENAEADLNVYMAIHSDSNSLLISGPRDELDRIEQLLDELMVTFVSSEDEYRLFKVEHADPVAVARTLDNLYNVTQPLRVDDRGNQFYLPPRIAVVTDPRSRTIIVRAKPSDFVVIQSLIEQFDAEGAPPQIAFRRFSLQNSQPLRILPTVQQMIAQLQQVRPGEPITVSPDVRTRSLVVAARPDTFPDVEAIIREADSPSSSAAVEVAMLSLKKANAGAVASVLQSMLRPSPSGSVTAEGLALQEQVRLLNLRGEEGQPVQLNLAEPIKIQADVQGGNRLIITSSGNNVEALRSVVTTLDSVPLVDGVTVRFARLEHGDANTVAATVRQIFQQGVRLGVSRVGRGEPENETGRALVNPVNVAVDTRTNTLVLSGQQASVALALGVIEDMDRAGESFVTEVRLFRLKHASAPRLLPLLRAVFNEGGPVPGSEGVSTQVTRLRTVLANAEEKTTEFAKNRSALVVQADPVTSTIIVAARSDAMPLITDVIQTLDVPNAGPNGVRLYPLNHGRADTIAEMIGNLQSGPRGSVMRAEDRATVSIDRRTNALIVAGNEKAFAFVESLLFQVDKQQDAGVKIEAIPLQYNEAQAVSTMVRQLFNQRRQSTAIPGESSEPRERVDVSFDRLTNTLIVSATEENLALVRDLLSTIDAEPVADNGVLQIFNLKHVDAQRAATMLRSLVRQGLYRPGVSQGGDNSTRERLAVAVDSRSNSLIVSASPDNIAVVKEVILQVDREGVQGAADLRLYSLKHASASRLGSILQRLFNARRAGEGLVGDPAGLVPVSVVPDPRTNTLIVTGSQESLEAVDSLVAQLDASEVRSDYLFRVFPLERSTASTLRMTLQRLFVRRPRRAGTEPPQPITIVADNWANALIVVALPEDLELVDSLVEKLDGIPPSPKTNVHVIPLAKASAQSVIGTVQALYRDSGAGGRGGGSGVTVTVDERLNALVVSAGEADYERIVELVTKLDTSTVASVNEIRVFPLRAAEAAELAPILSDALNRRATTRGDEDRERQTLLQFVTRAAEGEEIIATALQEGVLVTADTRTNSLVVSAPVDSLPLLEQIIAKLDATSPRVAQINVFPLVNADARQMGRIVSEVFRLQATGVATDGRPTRYQLLVPSEEDLPVEGEARSEPSAVGGLNEPIEVLADDEAIPYHTSDEPVLTISVDIRTNSLIVAGTEHYVDLAGEIITKLDSSPVREQITRVYRLRNAQAENIQEALTAFLEQRRQRLTTALGEEGIGSAQRLLEDDVAIVGEKSSNTLLVSASPRSFEQIGAIINELDQPQPQVLVQAIVAEVTLDSDTELGVDWDFNTDIANRPAVGGTDFGLREQVTQFGGLSTAVTGSDVTFFLRALQQEGRLEVLSRPQILAIDNQEATINIGQRVPQITGAVTTELGNINNVIEYRDVGVILRVTPRINPDGFVTMEVEPEISSLSSSSVDLGNGGQAPIFNERKATTTVSVQDGHTIIIGGLISTSDDERDEKVPVLGDIPLLGIAFRSRRVVTQRTELIIILTPHVISGVENSDSITQKAIERSKLKHGEALRVIEKQLQESQQLQEENGAADDPDAEPIEEEFSPAPRETAFQAAQF